MEFALTFLTLFGFALYYVGPILLMLFTLIVFLGQIVSTHEKWDRFDGFYWSFITATTVGYGDIRPLKRLSRLISILIALIGILFTGIILATAVETVSLSLKKHLDPAAIEQAKEIFEDDEIHI